MKSIIFIILLSLSFQFSSPKENPKIAEIEESATSSKIYVFDYEGNLLKSFIKMDVLNEEISILDYEILEKSDFAYAFNGDEYWFR